MDRKVWILLLVLFMNTVDSIKKCYVKDDACFCDVYIAYPINECAQKHSYVPPSGGEIIEEGTLLRELKAMKERATRLNRLENQLLHEASGEAMTSEDSIQATLSEPSGDVPEDVTLSDAGEVTQTEEEHYKTTVPPKGSDVSDSENTVEIETSELIEKLKASCDKIKQSIEKKTELFKKLDSTWSRKKRQLTKVRSNLFSTMSKMVTVDNELTANVHENQILKNQAKNTEEMLEERTEFLNKTIDEKDEMEKKYLLGVLSAKRTESELDAIRTKYYTYYNNVNETTMRHEELIVRNKQFVYELRVRERELMSCYRAKTSTFCGFEDKELCGFTQENKTDFFNWDRAKGKTPSSSTGPTGDNTCKSEHGHFMYIEASAKGKGNNAVMYSPRYRGLSKQCVEFYYHMHGRHVGILNVYTKTPSDELLSVWRAFGNQGNFWIAARLQVPEELARASYQMAFEGIAQNGYQGDIAIDDIRVTDGNCPVEARVQTVPIVLSGLKGNLTSFDSIIRKRRKHRNKKQQKTAQPG